MRATALRTKECLLVSISSMRAGTKSSLYLNTYIHTYIHKYRAYCIAEHIICLLKEERNRRRKKMIS